MAINENIYGSPLEWVPCYYQQDGLTNKNKKAWFGGESAQTQLKTGVSENKLSYNTPIDKSLAYCGFGTESALSHRAYIGKDTENTGYLKIYEYQDSAVSNWAFFEKSAQYGTTNNPINMGYIRTDVLGRTAWNDSIDDEWNYSNYLEPYVFVNPHNMVLLINVVVGTSLDTSQMIDLSTYIANRANYPYLYAVYGNLYFGEYPERNLFAGKGTPPTGWKTTTLQCLDNYICDEKNINLPMYGISYGGSCILMGSPTRSNTLYNDNDILNLFYVTENGKDHLKIQRVDNSVSNVYIEYYDELIEDILKTAACFGLYFTTKDSVAIGGALTDNDMYIGLLDDNGIGHGEYLRGAQTENAPQAANDFDNMHNLPYNPYESVDTSKYKNGTNFNTLDINLNSLNRFYVLTQPQVEQLATELYTIMGNVPSTDPIERYNQVVFLTQNPIDCIVSIKRFPVNVPHSGTDTTLKMGSASTSITNAHYLNKSTQVYYFSFNNNSDTGLYKTNNGSFLDYEPFTKVQINVPFCGSFDVPCNYFHEYGGVDIALLIDFITGACTAFLMVNNNVVDSIQGNCGIDVPLSGLQTATIDSQIFNASMSKQKQDNNFALSMLGGAAAIALGVATGGAAAVVGGAAAMAGGVLNKVTNDKSLDYELNHMQAPVKQVSSASPVIGFANDLRCKMIISRPEYADGYNSTVYGETVGFACLLNGYVSDFNGFTIGKINLDGINAPKEVKEMIESAFASGVYL